MREDESRPLLQRLQRIIERTYDLETGIRDVSPFIIGDEGFARLYDGRSVTRSVGAGHRDGLTAARGFVGAGRRQGPLSHGNGRPGICERAVGNGPFRSHAILGTESSEGYAGRSLSRSGISDLARDDPPNARASVGAALRGETVDSVGARMLLRQEGGGLRASLYYPDRLIENLERNDPGRTLSDGNVDDFATLIEELDHLLTIADRHRAGAEVSLLELELHANVTKELVLRLFVARMRGRDQLLDDEGSWIRHHLFDKVEYREEDPAVQARYRDAASLAVRYLDALRSLPADDRPRELRRFHRRSHHEKLAHLSRL